MKIACCMCGTSIDPNDAAMCIQCLRNEIDMSALIGRGMTELVRCKKCDRWLTSRDHWQHHELESAGLLAMCLKKIPALSNGKATLLDAAWVWTEPHSLRLKVKVTFEAGVLDDKVKLKQTAVADFIVKNKQCLDCIREATDHTWGAMIQIRQRVGHKQSLYMVEHLLTKKELHTLMLNVEVTKDGLT